uniref:ATP synthase complex subunit 8 n=1 Tax=Lepidopsocidae sp. RS-2001 TaxID=159971 RepID=Q7YHM1_9NEOP|nr:ATP synthase F0 subunit 8 [Lepidopsocidae sp. RS-2001]AAP44717.1 ATP synthase subunit 8 [Lepidopsocidae sp. RS-2001]
MPQMMPMPWLSLFFLFLLTLLMTNCINYFYFQPNIFFSKKYLNIKKNIWKW